MTGLPARAAASPAALPEAHLHLQSPQHTQFSCYVPFASAGMKCMVPSIVCPPCTGSVIVDTSSASHI